MEPIIIFSHIPKTGGLTMRRIFDHHYKPGEIFKYPAHAQAHKIRLSPKQIASIRCAYGHCRFGVHKLFKRPFKYVTMVREPLNRIVSAYYFIRSSPANRLYNIVRQMTLEEFIFTRDKRIVGPNTNHQTRFISGSNKPDLRLALENIRRHYLLVGITEMYPHSVFLLNRTMGWKHIPYTKENVTRNRPKKVPLTQAMVDHVRKRNELDYRLYEFCKARLQRRLKELPPEAKSKLNWFVKVHQK